MTEEGPCNIVGPRAQYQQAKGDNAYMKAFKSAYNKYRYQEQTKRITSAQFEVWASTARSLRDLQINSAPTMSAEEFKKTISGRSFFDGTQTPQ